MESKIEAFEKLSVCHSEESRLVPREFLWNRDTEKFQSSGTFEMFGPPVAYAT